MTPAKANLLKRFPLMACGNKFEFQQRLQWLSEGMLRNHIEGVINYKTDAAEILAYRQYKEELR